jgi:hypothetical protein
MSPCPRCGRVHTGLDIDAALEQEREDVEAAMAAYHAGLPLEQALAGAYSRGYQRAIEHSRETHAGC